MLAELAVGLAVKLLVEQIAERIAEQMVGRRTIALAAAARNAVESRNPSKILIYCGKKPAMVARLTGLCEDRR